MSDTKRKSTRSTDRFIAGLAVVFIIGMAVFSAVIIVGLVF